MSSQPASRVEAGRRCTPHRPGSPRSGRTGWCHPSRYIPSVPRNCRPMWPRSSTYNCLEPCRCLSPSRCNTTEKGRRKCRPHSRCNRHMASRCQCMLSYLECWCKMNFPCRCPYQSRCNTNKAWRCRCTLNSDRCLRQQGKGRLVLDSETCLRSVRCFRKRC